MSDIDKMINITENLIHVLKDNLLQYGTPNHESDNEYLDAIWLLKMLQKKKLMEEVEIAQDTAEYYVKELGKEGALRQATDELCNSDTLCEIDFFLKVIDAINEI